MLKDLFKYKVAFKVPVVMLFFSVLGVYFDFIKIDLWSAKEFIGGGYQFQINFSYLLEMVANEITNIFNQLKGEF